MNHLGWTISGCERRRPVDRALRRAEKGQTLVEYALILTLTVLVVVGALAFLGGEVSSVFNQVANDL